MKKKDVQTPKTRAVQVEAPGKVNLYLEMCGLRSDGYHELRSIVMPVSLYETVTVTARFDGEVTVETVGEGVDCSVLQGLPLQKQLAYKAWAAMKEAKQWPDFAAGCDIRIVKRVPIGAGMGGGSADAAGVMVALRQLWKSPEIPDDEWLAAGARTGSDVPALMLGGAVEMKGRGEIVKRMFLSAKHRNERIRGSHACFGYLPETPQKHWLVIVFPGVEISTSKVYTLFDEQEKENKGLTSPPSLWENCARSVHSGPVEVLAKSLRNDLQPVASRICPEIEQTCSMLREAGAVGTLLSGSGSAVFGLAENEVHAREIHRKLPPTVWSKVVQTLPDGVMAAHGPLVP